MLNIRVFVPHKVSSIGRIRTWREVKYSVSEPKTSFKYPEGYRLKGASIIQTPSVKCRENLVLKPQAPDTLVLMCECLSLLLSPSNGHKNQNNGHSMSDLLRTG